jgi:Uma2 family endonuclease
LAKKKTGEAFNEVFVDFGKKTFGVDVAVLFKEHSDRHREGRLSGAPDIVAEIVSDDSSTRDRIDKFKAYWEYQVPWYWIGDPTAGTLEEYQWTAQGYVRTSEGSLDNPFEPRALPGLKVDMATLVE